MVHGHVQLHQGWGRAADGRVVKDTWYTWSQIEVKFVNTQHIKNLNDTFLTKGPYMGKVSVIRIFDTSWIDENMKQNTKDDCFRASCISGTLNRQIEKIAGVRWAFSKMEMDGRGGGSDKISIHPS